jgi:glycosyltransferase involved in cell wall biosynthesis
MTSIALNCIALDSARPVGVERFARNVLGTADFGDNPVECFVRSTVPELEAVLGAGFTGRHPGLRRRALALRRTPLRILGEMLLLPFLSRNADVVLSINNFGPLWGKRGQRRLVVVHDVWFLAAEYEGGALSKVIFRLLLRLQLNRSSGIVTVSEFSRREICSHFAVEPGDVTVVGNCLGRSVEPAPVEQAARPRFLLLIGSARRNKNVLRALEGFTRYRAANPDDDMGLVVVGNYPRDWVDRARARFPQLGDEVIDWRGFVDDAELDALYSGSSGVVFVSLYEGFGIPAMEAVLRGRPALVAAGTATAEILGDLALTVDGLDTDAIAHGIAALPDHEVPLDSAAFRAFRDRHMNCQSAADALSALVLAG